MSKVEDLGTYQSIRHCVHPKKDTDIAIAEIKARISYLATLQRGWDGYDASPMSNAVLDNIDTFLNNANEKDLVGWYALPEINGTITLQNDTLKAGIQVGDNAFSYFIIKGDKVSGGDNITFTVPAIVSILRDING